VIVVRLPAEALLEIDGSPTTQTGAVRRFRTPGLRGGRSYTYTLRATWDEDGERRTVTRRVRVTPGEETQTDLPPPTLGLAPWGPGLREGYSVLTVENGTATDAVVRVVQLGGKGQLVRNFYIPSGKQLTAEEVPAGRYVLRVAFGKDWDSDARKFTAARSFSETEAFDISQEETAEGVRYTRLRVTLHKVIGGNFRSDPITEDDFLRSQEP
jgi:uncharacterized protein (TIGR03000 family)